MSNWQVTSVTDPQCSHHVSTTSVCYQSTRIHNHMESSCFIHCLDISFPAQHSDDLCIDIKRANLVIIISLISMTKGQTCWLTQG